MASILDALGVAFTPYAWLGHVLLGLCIQLAAAVPLRWCGVRAAWWIAAALSSGFWWGREKVEYEFLLKAQAGLHTLGPFWWRGWIPVEWGTASLVEFVAPSLASILVAAVMSPKDRGFRVD